jgi:hypothetical protein
MKIGRKGFFPVILDEDNSASNLVSSQSSPAFHGSNLIEGSRTRQAAVQWLLANCPIEGIRLELARLESAHIEDQSEFIKLGLAKPQSTMPD